MKPIKNTLLLLLCIAVVNIYAVPTAPTFTDKSTPAQFATCFTDLNPSYTWVKSTASAGATMNKYFVQVALTYNGFGSPFLTKWTTDASTTTLQVGTLGNGITYYWRVGAEEVKTVNGVTTKSWSYSDIRSFTTKVGIPTSVACIELFATKAIVTWNHMEGAASYEYTVNTFYNKSFTQPATTKVGSPITIQIDGLNHGVTNTFKVKAIASSSCASDYSAPISFTPPSVNFYREVMLTVPLYWQECNNWCWDACTQMIHRYYNNALAASKQWPNPTQQQIADYGVKGACRGNWTAADDAAQHGTTVPAGDRPVLECLKNFGNIVCTYHRNAPAWTTITREVGTVSGGSGNPLHLRMTWSGGGGHAVVLKGYTGDRSVAINDPWPVNQGVYFVKDYEEYMLRSPDKDGKKGIVDGYLDMTSKPGSNPNGANDIVVVSRPARKLHLSDTVTFTGQLMDTDLSGTTARFWDWQLVLFHENGEYVAGTPEKEMLSDVPRSSTWSVCVNTLPSGYSWKRNVAGEIEGQVIIGCLDSDAPYYYHLAYCNVSFDDAKNRN